jgi:hypothetical protein
MTEATYTAPPHGWTCFHCGETFTTPRTARDHFGTTPDEKPGCVLKVELGGQRGLIMELRRLQDENRKLHDDISDETTFYRDYHAKLASDISLISSAFKGCRSLRDVFNVYDSMEGRAIAAESLLDLVASEYLHVVPFDMPTGAGDADVGWLAMQSHQGKTEAVELHRVWEDDVRKLLRELLEQQFKSTLASASSDAA